MVTVGTPRPQVSRLSPLGTRSKALERLLGLLTPFDKEALNDALKASNGKGPSPEDSLACTPCSSYQSLIAAWHKAMRWTDGLDHALSVMLASVASTQSVGDQLWIKVMGPAACGKSTLCEAISVCKKHVLAKSTIRGFHSGYALEGGGRHEDHSLIKDLSGKTLVTKDGDTLLQSPNLSQILAEARDIYDGTSRTHYRNAQSHTYEGLRTTWLLCGTSSLRKLDQSELGERFLNCIIMDKIDSEQENEILWWVAQRANRNSAIEVDGEPKTRYEPELAEAMQLTGGYVQYLRDKGMKQMSSVKNSNDSTLYCTKLGKFIAFMRARPSCQQEELAEREFGTRLVSQLVKLARCLTLVLNRESVDDAVVERVRRVALDTSRGQTLELVSYLYEKPEGSNLRAIAVATSIGEHKTGHLLRFLRQIGAVKQFEARKGRGIGGGVLRWKVTEEMRGLYREVVEGLT